MSMNTEKKSVLQDWTFGLSFMQQSVRGIYTSQIAENPLPHLAPPVLVEPLEPLEPEPVAAPIPVPEPVPPPAPVFATPEELKPLRLEYPPRFRACEPFRDEISAAVRKHWGIYQFPEAWTAQIWQESLCNPRAVSPVGAQGIAQIMPATWAEEARRANLPPGTTPHDRIAIEIGASYQARMMRGWTSPRPDHERWRLGLASYNAGLGSALAAQRRCGGARMWAGIQPCLRQVTGERNSHETTTYVQRIEQWWRALRGCGFQNAPAGDPRRMGVLTPIRRASATRNQREGQTDG